MAQILVARSPRDLEPDPMSHALLFDLDGTLVDSFAANYRAYRRVLERVGISIPAAWYEDRFALPGPELLEMARQEWEGNFDVDELVAQKDHEYRGLIESVEVFASTTDLLKTHSGAKRIAVVTSGPSSTASPMLAETGLARYVPVLVTRDDVEHTKPSPEPYLTAINRLDVEPTDCVAYEDTDLGLRSATAAGVKAIDVRRVCRTSWNGEL